MGLAGRRVRVLLACVALQSMLYVVYVNLLLSRIDAKQAVVDAYHHAIQHDEYAVVWSIAQFVQRILYPKTTRRDGTFRCLKFQHTGECPSSYVSNVVTLFHTPSSTERCDTNISTGLHGVSGYFEVQSDVTGDVISTMHMACSRFTNRDFSCDVGAQYASYGWDSLQYRHEPLALEAGVSISSSSSINHPPLPVLSNSPQQSSSSAALFALHSGNHLRQRNDHVSTNSPPNQPLLGSRGIVFVVHPGILATAFASIRRLRQDLNCSLPIEVWYRPDEMEGTNPLLTALVTQFQVHPRVIDHPLATRFFTKPYALYYSAFDNVLLLDSDNFAIRNPEFLFDEPTFVATGALFWPDYWKPGNSLFGLNGFSSLWDLTGIDFVDMFEQESGQLLVNKRASEKALDVLMFYSFHTPRLVTDLGLVHGDKDLYRLAWLKSELPFHMIERPPGSLGRRLRSRGGRGGELFCGNTMVQYAPDGSPLFFHRNTEKMTGCGGDSLSWESLQEFRYKDVHVSKYRPTAYQVGESKCFGHPETLVSAYTEVSRSSYTTIEATLLKYAREGMRIQHPEGGKATEPAAATEALGDVAKKTHDEVKKNMRGAVANYIKVLSAMRPGQADAGIFDSLMVSAYGQMASLTELAQVSVVGPTELAVTIYDPSLLTDIRTGIEGLNPSFSVQPSGATLSVRFPKYVSIVTIICEFLSGGRMTKETRDELVKAAKKQAESARQHVRRVRQDGMNEIKKLKDSISEDDVKVEQDKIQKLTDDHIAEITRLLASKERALAVI
ncbi:hypothetical protein DYB37_011318 [Aphanomyces astaci]|uniref:Ribosome recycling factor domain-containing protein n=1 Tax=Aphanomyces astaci TaxID=112090 RepID=A0A418EBL8_APHAT|nr:hypothetical protein DYB37_011318 [Aphanomyces astaci]